MAQNTSPTTAHVQPTPEWTWALIIAIFLIGGMVTWIRSCRTETRAREVAATLVARRAAEEQRLADERDRREAPEKLRALLATRPVLDGTYMNGFGSNKLTLKVISFDSGTGFVSGEVKFAQGS
jgi:hypothetical protein